LKRKRIARAFPRGRQLTPSLGRCWLVLLLVLLTLSAGSRAHDEHSDLERRVQAAYLYNFTKFVEWPAGALGSPEDPFPICVLANNAPVDHLAPLEKRAAGSHPIVVRPVNLSDDFSDCHILLLHHSAEEQLPQILARVDGRPVLTAGNIQDFAERGGIVGFVIHQGKVRLEINRGMARRSGLKLSAKLLEVGLRVIDEPDGETAP
jgi:hypothetical protein